jgi:hypothetical protein
MSQMSTGLSDSEVGPLVVRPAQAAIMLSCGITQVYALINTKELDAFLDGHARKITVESIRRYIAKRLATGLEKVGKIDPAIDASLESRRQRRAQPGTAA